MSVYAGGLAEAGGFEDSRGAIIEEEAAVVLIYTSKLVYF
jgi:hypothetical protein